MSEINKVTRSLRASRLYARAPRAIALVLAALLIAAGLRTTLAGQPKAAPLPPAPRVTVDRGAEAFAEGFARAYLTWSSDDPVERERRLAPYVAGLDQSGGLRPAVGTHQSVVWTAVVGEQPTSDAELITVAAQTDTRVLYLNVPVSRDARGFLSIPAYPAVVGPPATNDRPEVPNEEAVDDDALVKVVERAIRNYLAGNHDNLLADLAPDALVSPPTEPLKVTSVDQVSWVMPSRRVAVQLDAEDGGGSGWTLRYELDVRKTDRWYVESIQVNPTFQGDK
jgi:hypothetical protein